MKTKSKPKRPPKPENKTSHKLALGPIGGEGKRREEAERRERLTRRMLEEAARLAHSDASKTFRGDIWRQALGQIAGMKTFPKPLFAGFGGGGPGSASLVGAQWTQVGPAPLRVNFSTGVAPVAGRVYALVSG